MTLLHLAFMVMAAQVTPRSDTLHILLIVDDTIARSSLVHGSMLGAEEAMHTGALFGTAALLRVEEARDSVAVARALRSSGAPSLVIVAGPREMCDVVVALTMHQALAVFDAGCAGAVADSDAYSLVSLPTASPADDSTHLELWHATLDRFGGEQLNQRYRRRFGSAMDSPAWAGWVAAKIALDLALHAHSTAPAALLAQLRSGRQQFDGQKGRPLYFDPGTRRLVQPLYRVAGNGAEERVVAEVNP